MDYIQTHWVEIIAIIGSIVTVASAIAALTPNKEDDKWVAKIGGFVRILALAVGHAKPEKKE